MVNKRFEIDKEASLEKFNSDAIARVIIPNR